MWLRWLAKAHGAIHIVVRSLIGIVQKPPISAISSHGSAIILDWGIHLSKQQPPTNQWKASNPGTGGSDVLVFTQSSSSFAPTQLA